MTVADAFGPLLNAFRAANGLPALAVHPLCERAAQDHAADQARREVLTHGSGFENRDTAANRIGALGYRWGFAAENVAFGQRDMQAVLDAWANSPGHRANMLAGQAVHYGFGGASNRLGPYWVLVLAAPM
ncbi:CAP domain-containing protein [Mangrovicoccus sp. HB161399]|uniref:CAP domain-containing protein n=1 Tax=Mangrovicoccus sp. HB161399 TaxID=2720392 RepID=UPI001555F393